MVASWTVHDRLPYVIERHVFVVIFHEWDDIHCKEEGKVSEMKR